VIVFVCLLVSYFLALSLSLIFTTCFAESIAGKGSRINYNDWLIKTSITHSVTLVGWPVGLPYCPKKLSLSKLKQIQKALVEKKIYYRQMSEEECEKATEQAGLSSPTESFSSESGSIT
jgi:hypothetical protein